MQKKLSMKITIFVLFILLVTIIVIILSVYSIFKSFYKEHLTKEVEHRIASHAIAIESKYDIDTINHVLTMEQTETVRLVLFDDSFAPLVTSNFVQEEMMAQYQQWLQQMIRSASAAVEPVFPMTEHVGIESNKHIQHVWSMYPLTMAGEVRGYLFIDQGTGEFEQAKSKIFWILFIMGLLSFLMGLILTIYLTRKISNPLHQMGQITHRIAQGEFEANIQVSGEDEVGQLAKDIQLMAKQLQEYRDSRKQFLSNVSHDLRTPLTYIKGYSALMKDADAIDEQEWRRNIEVIHKEAVRMELLVGDIFQLSKLDVGQIQLHLERVELVVWMDKLLKDKQLLFDQHAVEWFLNSNRQETYLCMDRERMAQVINNLLDNSTKYSKKGSKIFVTIHEEGDQVQIEIRDTGIGIPAEDLPYIFERFYRVDKSRSVNLGGSGLGLSIAKELVHLHGGTISVQSKVGEGTIFTISLNHQAPHT